MLIDLDKLLSSLPVAEEDAETGIAISGRLAPSARGEICILVGDLGLYFLEVDVLRIEASVIDGLAKEPISSAGMQVVIRRGAPLLDICLSKTYEGFIPGHKPFALAVRPLTIKTNFNSSVA
jgi:hypothetical protein